jgi:alpha-ketoglutarate-dependent taurine dioxygenase
VSLEIQPLAEPLGARVFGWDPGQPLEGEDRARIHRALRRYLVLVFQGHPTPSDADLVQYAGSFGELIKGSEWFRDAGDLPEILPVTNAVGADGIALGTGGAGSLEWHADYSYSSRPAKESFLEAVELPADAPRTFFCSQYAALETLPAGLAKTLRGLRAYHSITEYVDPSHPRAAAGVEKLTSSFDAKRRRDELRGIERPPIPEAEHPVIMRHPESGRELVYVSKGITRYLIGMAREESNAMLKELHQHAIRDEGVYAHAWEVGDLVMFDALGTMHRRDAWNSAERRSMRQLSTLC